MQKDQNNKDTIKDFTFKTLIVAGVALLFLLIIAIAVAFYPKVPLFFRILNPFIYGCGIAYILTPFCNFIEKTIAKLFKKQAFVLSIFFVEVFCAISLIILFGIVIPESITAASDIIQSIPVAIAESRVSIDSFLAEHQWAQDMFGNSFDDIVSSSIAFYDKYLNPFVAEHIPDIFNVISDIGRFLANSVISIIVSIFVLYGRRKFKDRMRKIIVALFNKKTASLITEELVMADKMFGNFFVGKILDSIIIGIICFVSLTIMKMPYASIVSIIVCVTNIIPFIGPFIGAIPGVIIIFSKEPSKAIYFLIFIFILQQIDGHYIGPKCIGTTTNLNTFWVLFSLIVFGGLFGIPGFLIGVPTFAVLYDIFNKYIDKQLRKKHYHENSTEISMETNKQSENHKT